MNLTIRYNDEQGPQDVYAKLADGSEVFIVANVTEAGADWAANEMCLVDDGDRAQIELLAADVRKRLPVRYSWHWQQAQYERLMNLPRRGALGRFKTQGYS